jgi:hypothetical protein
LILSFKAFAALNPTDVDAEISISSPVFGLRPLRADLARGSNVPKPAMLILFPSTTIYTKHKTKQDVNMFVCVRVCKEKTTTTKSLDHIRCGIFCASILYPKSSTYIGNDVKNFRNSSIGIDFGNAHRGT